MAWPRKLTIEERERMTGKSTLSSDQKKMGTCICILAQQLDPECPIHGHFQPEPLPLEAPEQPRQGSEITRCTTPPNRR